MFANHFLNISGLEKDKLDFAWQLGFMLEAIFANDQATIKKFTCLKIGQNWPRNNYLVILTKGRVLF